MTFLPAKMLLTATVDVAGVAKTVDDPNDAWAGYPYAWDINISLTGAQPHSSPNTHTPFYYTGMDISVGDWIADLLTGTAVQIINISSQDDYNITLTVEDIDRYNMFSDPTGSATGFNPGGTQLIFSLDDKGLPLLFPMTYAPSLIQQNPGFLNDLETRFRDRNVVSQYIRVLQPGHGINIGEPIFLDVDGLYKRSLADSTVNRMVGLCSDVGNPTPDYFQYKPSGTLVKNMNPQLPGNPGDLIYIHPTLPGQLTNVKPKFNAKPVYIRLETGDRALLLDRGNEGDTDTFTRTYLVPTITSGMVEFIMPDGCVEVELMTINGMENKNFTYSSNTKTVLFDPLETGYGIDEGDEVIFMYRTF